MMLKEEGEFCPSECYFDLVSASGLVINEQRLFLGCMVRLGTYTKLTMMIMTKRGWLSGSK